MKMRAKDGLISQAEFLRRAGLSRSRFKVLVAEGLPLHGKSVDFAEASAWIESNVDPRRRGNWQGDASLNSLRREREQIRIEESKLALAKARGALIERTTVGKFIAERGRMERDRWLSWASAVSARLAADLGADHGRLFAVIEGEVRDHLRQLAAEKLGEPSS